MVPFVFSDDCRHKSHLLQESLWDHVVNSKPDCRENQAVRTLAEYYRCPDEYAAFEIDRESAAVRDLEGVRHDISSRPVNGYLPYDPSVWVDNLRCERYVGHGSKNTGAKSLRKIVRNAYYLARPLMPVSVRKHLQKIHLRGWEKIQFPSWPVDRTVEQIMESLLITSIKTRGITEIPFIWFWPDGHNSCAIMTHDVETDSGRDFCSHLMDINDRRTIKSSFQIVPEERYAVSPAFLNSIRDRGFEINVHDLNHDGHLFSEYELFRSRADRINRYGKEYGAAGFRSAVLYRNSDWLGALEFSYDMSFPNVAHLDPQRGGCCTVMPFFIGEILELPLTATQDYSLFNVLNNYSLDLWKRQIALITEKHGLVSFIVHPDYIIEKRARKTYEDLLDYLAQLRIQQNIWIALPKEVDHWWRQRSQMALVQREGSWQIEGPGKDRAQLAFARLDGDRLVYTIARGTGLSRCDLSAQSN